MFPQWFNPARTLVQTTLNISRKSLGVRGIVSSSRTRKHIELLKCKTEGEDVPSSEKRHNFRHISVVGSGVLAELLMNRYANAAGVSPQITFYDKDKERSSVLEFQHPGSTVADSIQDAAGNGVDLLVLAVKPQNMDEVAKEIRGSIMPNTVVLSILAGTPIDMIAAKLKVTKVVRAMPNTPCAVGEGMTVWTATKTLTEEDRDGVEALFASTGENLFVDDENYIDMATAVSASGPAYVYLAMEAMVDAGVMMGFPRSIAAKLVQSTFQGTGAYAMQSSRHLAQMRTDITSPGGTTAAALYGLEKGGMRTALCDAVFAAYNRTQELGREL